MLIAKRAERLLRSVGGRTHPVGSETNPGEECGQRNPVEDPWIQRIFGLAEQNLLKG